MMAKIPTRINRALMRTSPRKNTITMKLNTIESAENATESGKARMCCQNVSGGITSAVVFPISSDTWTME